MKGKKTGHWIPAKPCGNDGRVDGPSSPFLTGSLRELPMDASEQTGPFDLDAKLTNVFSHPPPWWAFLKSLPSHYEAYWSLTERIFCLSIAYEVAAGRTIGS